MNDQLATTFAGPQGYWVGKEVRDVRDGSIALRDFFAAAALTGLLSNLCPSDLETTTEAAYRYSDAILAQREKGKSA